MSVETIPVDTRMAGPEPGKPRPARSWSYHLDDAEEDLRQANSYRLDRDDPAAERKLRLEAIARVREALDKAEHLLLNPPKPTHEPEHTGEENL